MPARVPEAAPSQLVSPLLRFAAARGATIDATAFGVEADAATRTDPVTVVPAQLARMFDAVAAALDEPHVGLLLPSANVWGGYALPDLAARASATLRDSLSRLAKYASLLSPTVALRLDEARGENGLARFAHKVVGHPRGLGRHVNELAMAIGLHEIRERTGVAITVREVCFIHARPRDVSRLREHFGTESLRFGGVENALVFDAAALDLPQRTADPRLLATIEPLAERAVRARPAVSDGFRAIVAARVRERLSDGNLELRGVAVSMRMSARTLQRRLLDEGTTFADVLDAVREAVARELVAAGDVPLGEVAWRLGYAEPATFARAFKRWTGVPPGAYRDGDRQGE